MTETYGEDPYLGQRHERRLHPRAARGRPGRGRDRVRQALPRLCDDRGRPEHGRDRGRPTRAPRRLRPPLRGRDPAGRPRRGDGLLRRVRGRADPHLPRGGDRPAARPDGLHRDRRLRLRGRRLGADAAPGRGRPQGSRLAGSRRRHGRGAPERPALRAGAGQRRGERQGARVPAGRVGAPGAADKFALGLFDNPYVAEIRWRSPRWRARATSCPGGWRTSR